MSSCLKGDKGLMGKISKISNSANLTYFLWFLCESDIECCKVVAVVCWWLSEEA